MPIVSNIAVVDDEPEVRDILSKIVKGLGHNPVSLKSGKELLERVGKSELFDLVLLDVVMPSPNGLSVLKEMRLPTSKHRLTPVLMVTGYADEKIIEASRKLNADGFILKPFDEPALRERIKKSLPRGVSIADFRRLLAKAMMPDSQHFQRTPLAVLDDVWEGFPIADGKDHYGVFVNRTLSVKQVAKAKDAELTKDVRIFKQEEGGKWIEMRVEMAKVENNDILILDMLIDSAT